MFVKSQSLGGFVMYTVHVNLVICVRCRVVSFRDSNVVMCGVALGCCVVYVARFRLLALFCRCSQLVVTFGHM